MSEIVKKLEKLKSDMEKGLPFVVSEDGPTLSEAIAALQPSSAEREELARELNAEYLANVIQAKTSLTGHQLYGAARAVHSLVVQRVLQERAAVHTPAGRK